MGCDRTVASGSARASGGGASPRRLSGIAIARAFLEVGNAPLQPRHAAMRRLRDEKEGHRQEAEEDGHVDLRARPLAYGCRADRYRRKACGKHGRYLERGSWVHCFHGIYGEWAQGCLAHAGEPRDARRIALMPGPGRSRRHRRAHSAPGLETPSAAARLPRG